MSAERRRLTYALLLSLLIHTLLLSLTFGGQGLWLPGFGFPWQHRRIEVPDLRVLVVPEQVTVPEPTVTPVAKPSQRAGVEQPVVCTLCALALTARQNAGMRGAGQRVDADHRLNAEAAHLPHRVDNST